MKRDDDEREPDEEAEVIKDLDVRDDADDDAVRGGLSGGGATRPGGASH